MRVILLLSIILMAGCTSSKAWIIAQGDDGGVIGYKMGDGPKAEQQLDRVFDKKVAEICGTRKWRIVTDRKNGRSGSMTIMQPTTSTTNSSARGYGSDGSYARAYGQSTTTSYQPVTYQTYESWREALIECDGQVEVKWNSPVH